MVHHEVYGNLISMYVPIHFTTSKRNYCATKRNTDVLCLSHIENQCKIEGKANPDEKLENLMLKIKGQLSPYCFLFTDEFTVLPGLLLLLGPSGLQVLLVSQVRLHLGLKNLHKNK